jgi:hypothetical protein
VGLDGSGTAALTIAGLTVRTHLIGATYNGDGNFTASAGATTEHVTADATSATLTVTTTTAKAKVSFIATIRAAAPGSGIPTGTVTFFIDGKKRKTVRLRAGRAKFTLAQGLDAQPHAIKIIYNGSASFLKSKKGRKLDFVVGRGT